MSSPVLRESRSGSWVSIVPIFPAWQSAISLRSPSRSSAIPLTPASLYVSRMANTR